MGQYTHLEQSSAQEILSWAIPFFNRKLAVATSFQKEGMVVIDMAARISREVRVFTLDTGRLPEETYRMIETVRERYGIRIEIVSPNHGEIDSMVERYGPNLFYREVPLRMLCCEVRKARPLQLKLKSLEAWVTGLRRGQSESRSGIGKLEEGHGALKINPLADWTASQVEAYIRQHDVPVHPLYAKGYSSIGCAPCTRAVEEGEGERAGRWWWEQDAAKECGIHFSANGKAQRKLDVLLEEVLVVKNA